MRPSIPTVTRWSVFARYSRRRRRRRRNNSLGTGSSKETDFFPTTLSRCRLLASCIEPLMLAGSATQALFCLLAEGVNGGIAKRTARSAVRQTDGQTDRQAGRQASTKASCRLAGRTKRRVGADLLAVSQLRFFCCLLSVQRRLAVRC